MEFRELLRRLVNSYFVIYGCCFLGAWIFCIVFEPDATFGLDYCRNMMIFALLGDLPGLIFWSSKELSKKQWNIRLYLHFGMVEIVLLLMGRYLHMYETLPQGIFFAGIVLLVYCVVRGVCFAWDLEMARVINEKLKEMKKQ